MSYLVMECHPAYAVVLDEQGRFLKAANLNYQVGQELSEITQLNCPSVMEVPRKHRYRALASLAACLCLVAVTGWNLIFTAYGTVRIRINPDVQLSVNRFDYVIRAQGLNPDGEALLEGEKIAFRKADQVSGWLTHRAEELGYLGRDGTIRFAVESEHDRWRGQMEEELAAVLQSDAGTQVTVTPVLPEELDDDDFDDDRDDSDDDREFEDDEDAEDADDQDDGDEPDEDEDEDEPDEDESEEDHDDEENEEEDESSEEDSDD